MAWWEALIVPIAHHTVVQFIYTIDLGERNKNTKKKEHTLCSSRVLRFAIGYLFSIVELICIETILRIINLKCHNWYNSAIHSLNDCKLFQSAAKFGILKCDDASWNMIH